MATFRNTLSALAALNVPGAVHNYDVDATPNALSRAQLPALLVLPGKPTPQSPATPPGSGFEALAFGGAGQTVTYTVTHLLLVAPVDAAHGARSHLPTLIDLIDAYFMTLGADVTLGGTLIAPPQVQVAPGIYTHGGVSYHGCAFVHGWVLAVS